MQKLDSDLKSALRSDLEDVSLALLMTPAQFDAHLIRKATKVSGSVVPVMNVTRVGICTASAFKRN